MAYYTYNDALSRLVKSLDMKSPVAYISDMTGIHSSNIYKYLSNKKVLGINSYKAICEKIDADPCLSCILPIAAYLNINTI